MSGVNTELATRVAKIGAAMVTAAAFVPNIDKGLKAISDFMTKQFGISDDRSQAIALWLSTGAVVLPQLTGLPPKYNIVTV